MQSVIKLCALFFFLYSVHAAELKTRNVVLIITDGFRWQEVFRGADPNLMSKEAGGVKNTNELTRDFWRGTPDARREALMPFLWNHIALRGQILGNQDKGSVVRVSNGKNFSYPGYSELLCGVADPRIDSNDKRLNQNTNVFEWINNQKGFHGKVSVFGTWDDFPYIFNVDRSGLRIWPAWENRFRDREIAVPAYFRNIVQDSTPLFEGMIQDGVFFHAVMDHMKTRKPRALFVGFGETDEWAHAGRYDLYLHAAHLVDDYVRRLWETAQSIPQYRDKTTFIVTADHGRGNGAEWKGHGEKIKGSEGDWLAVIGPDTPALGERENTAPSVHAQIPATLAGFLGLDFHSAFPQSGQAIPDMVER